MLRTEGEEGGLSDRGCLPNGRSKTVFDARRWIAVHYGDGSPVCEVWVLV